MKILILSPEGDGFSLALALMYGGDKVKVYTRNKDLHLPMVGLVPKIDNLTAGLKWADLIIGDMVGLGSLEAQLRKSKVPFLAISLVMDAMELDRHKQMDLMKKVGIQLPPTFEFSGPGEALSILQHWSEPGYVIKPSGNISTAKTMVIEDKETFKWALDQLAADQELIVQKIVIGVEISTEGWFNGTEWVGFNHTFEEKRFLNNGLGQNVGCAGNIVIQGKADSILSQELQKLTPLLKSSNYRGPIDINHIVNDNGPHALELTPRLGYDAIEALWAMSDKDKFSSFLLSVATGGTKELAFDYNVGCAVRLSLPPYPMSEPDSEDAGLPIQEKPNNEVLWSDAYLDGKQLRWAAFDGVLAKVVGAGDDVFEARAEAYANVKDVQALNLQYRTDIGERVMEDISTLSVLGVRL